MLMWNWEHGHQAIGTIIRTQLTKPIGQFVLLVWVSFSQHECLGQTRVIKQQISTAYSAQYTHIISTNNNFNEVSRFQSNKTQNRARRFVNAQSAFGLEPPIIVCAARILHTKSLLSVHDGFVWSARRGGR
jgi:hypothetical protein